MSRCKDAVKVLTVVSMFGVTPVSADNHSAVKNLEGFHVGIDAAYNHSSAKNEVTDSGYFGGEILKRRSDGDLYVNNHKCVGLSPSVNIGYWHGFGNWYAGFSLDASFGRKKERTFDMWRSEGYSRVKENSYGIKVKGGRCFDEVNTLAYVITGVNWQDIDFGFNMRDPQLRERVEYRTRAKLKTPLFVLGFGVEQLISKNISLSAEYEYAWRNSSGEARENYGVNGVYAYATMKQQVREHSVKVGFKYRF